MNVLILAVPRQSSRPARHRPHFHFNLLVCDLYVYSSVSSPSNLHLLSAHLPAEEEDRPLISEKTGDVSADR